MSWDETNNFQIERNLGSKELQVTDGRYPFPTIPKGATVTIEKLVINVYLKPTDSSFFESNTVFNVQQLQIDIFVTLTASMFEHIASFCSEKCWKVYFHTTTIDADVTFQLTFRLFPKLKELNIYAHNMDDWLGDLITSNVTGLRSLVIEAPMLQQGYSQALYTFCKQQLKAFKLILWFSTEECMMPQLEAALRPHFQRTLGNDDEDETKIKLHINTLCVELCYARDFGVSSRKRARLPVPCNSVQKKARSET